MKSPVERIRTWQDQFTAVRRDLHAHPELGFEEHRTARIVCEQLSAYGIEHHAGIGRTGVVAVIPGRANDSGKSIGLRADMDALPMPEETDSGHKPGSAGRMPAAVTMATRRCYSPPRVTCTKRAASTVSRI